MENSVLNLEVDTRFKIYKGEFPNGSPSYSPVMIKEAGRMARYYHNGVWTTVSLSGRENFVVVKEEQQVPAQTPGFQLKFA